MEHAERLKTKLISYIKWKCGRDWLKSQVDPALGVSIFEKFNPNALLVGFGRRFATYKRAHLLFTDLDRLARIVNNQEHPIQFVFAGKPIQTTLPGKGSSSRLWRYPAVLNSWVKSSSLRIMTWTWHGILFLGLTSG